VADCTGVDGDKPVYQYQSRSVENADDVPLRVYDTERPLLYFLWTEYAERDHVAGERISWQIFGGLS